MPSDRPAGVPAALLLAGLLVLGGLLTTWTPEVSGAPAPPGATTKPSVVYRYTGTGYEDVTAPSVNDAEDDVPMDPSVDTALYVGYEHPFDQMELRVGTPRSGGGVAWEYRIQTTWRELIPSDPSDGLARSGVRTVSWNPPPFWTATELDASQAPGQYYYLRLRVTQRVDAVARLSRIGLEAWTPAASVWSYGSQAWVPPPVLTMSDIQDVAYGPSFALAVASDGRVLRSADAGQRWARVATLDGDLRGLDLFDATQAVVVGSGGGIWRTSDGGFTWSRLNSGIASLLEAVDWVSDSLLVAVGDGVVLRSTDGGASWFKDPPANHYYGVQFSDERNGWIVGDSINRESIWQTTNAGVSWVEIDITYPNVKFAKSVYFRDANYGWIVGDQFKVRTRDGGTTWDLWGDSKLLKDIVLVSDDEGWTVGDGAIQRIRHAGGEAALVSYDTQFSGLEYPKHVSARSAQALLVTGSSGLILRTANAGRLWTQPNAHPQADLRALDWLPSGIVWAVGAAGTLLRSTDSGRNWSQYPSLGTGLLYDVDFYNDTHGWVVGENGLVRSTTDGGVTWTSQSVDTVAALYAVLMVSDRTGWIAGDLGKVFRTTTAGASWQAVSTPDPVPLRDLDHVGSDLYVAGGATLLSREDGGDAWQKLTIPNAADIQTVEFTTETNGWIGDTNGHVWETTNAGQSWTVQISNTGIPVYGIGAYDQDVAWTVAEGGRLLRTNNGGGQWTRMTTDAAGALYAVAGAPDGPGIAVGALGALRSTGGRWWDVNALRGGPDTIDLTSAPTLARGDALYIGQADPFDSVLVDVTTSARDASVVWEYPSGGSWQPLAALDGTASFSHGGLDAVKFPIPADWKPTRVQNETVDRFWVRARYAEPPHNGLQWVAEVYTLRLLQPVTVGGPTTSASASGTSQPRPTQLTDFAMTAEPATIDFGRQGPGSNASAALNLLAFRGTAHAALTIDGPAAPWLSTSAGQFELRQGVGQAVRLDLRVPADAPPGPAAARVVVRAQPLNAAGYVTGWVDVSLVVEAADLVEVHYETDPSRWSARFANYLAEDAHVRFEVGLKAPGADVRLLHETEADVAHDTNRTVTGDLNVLGLPAGPYDLRVTARFNESVRSRDVRIFLGPSPVAVEGLTVGVRPFENVTFTFAVRNLAAVPLVARPVVTVFDAGGDEVAQVPGAPLPLEANESRVVTIEWEPVFGAYRASVQVGVENAEPSEALEQPFVVKGMSPHRPSVLERNLPVFVALLVLVANAAAGLGLWTGRRRA
jgi:photosystem II stability/assembly factor-like uncharacterized protein